MPMKRCFKCNRLLPLWAYSRNKRKYQNATNKGRNYCCRWCMYKRWAADGFAWLWNRQTDKYQRVEFKSKIEILKRTLR